MCEQTAATGKSIDNEEILSRIRTLLETGDSCADQLGSIRATLLVNFGKDSKHNRYGFSIADDKAASTS